MKVALTGGGSGGHITPVLAVAHELKKHNPTTQTIYIGQRGDSLIDIPKNCPDIDSTSVIFAGKLRRYHGEGWRQLLDVPTVIKNLRDAFYVFIGIWQSFWLLRRLKPDVVFIKGGFVGVPVGLAAAALKIPFVTHDSDAMPGLANRIISRWATLHAVALPKEIYSYPPEKTEVVGVPVSSSYHSTSPQEISLYKKHLDLQETTKILTVTGGGNGSTALNESVVAIASRLLLRYPTLHIFHIAGRRNADELTQIYAKSVTTELRDRIHVKGFVEDMYVYSAIANVVFTRAGATSIAEFAAQSKACIVMPSPNLAGGHQLKNARVLEERSVVKVVDELQTQSDPDVLFLAITNILDNPTLEQEMGQRLAELAKTDSATRVAMLLLGIGKNSK